MAGSEIATAYLAIVPSMKGVKKAIEAEIGGVNAKGAGARMGGEASSGFSSAFSSALATASKAATAALAAAGAAAGAVGAQALASYASYEQLVGGVDKLFGEASGQLQKYAAEAYKTAGMGANQYMEQATSFSASLISSLGGDTARAAELANVAMVAMSDNVNVFGSNMQDVQNAFQGFAKQNYTMLDNLKLGYGGTQEEMKRLVSDAAALTDVQADLGLTVDEGSMSFDNIVKAIQVMQTEMGIAGTPTDEAAKTIEGSVNMAKAAWSNWVTELGKDNADMAARTDELVDSIGAAARNVVPRLGEIMGTAMAALPGLAAEVGPELAESLANAVGGAYEAVKASVDPAGAFDGLLSAMDELAGQAHSVADAWNAGGNPIESFCGAASAAMGFVLQDADEFASFLAQGLADGIPEVAAAAGELMSEFGACLADMLPDVLEHGLAVAEGLSESIREGAGTLVDAAMGMALNLAQGLADGIPSIVERVPEIVSNIAGVINDNAPKILETAVGIIWTLVQGLIGAIPTIVANIPQIITAMVDVFLAFGWANLGKSIIGKLKDGVLGMASSAKEAAKGIFEKISNMIAQLPAKLQQLGGNAIARLKDAIASKAAAAKEAAKGIFDKVVGEIKGLPERALQVGRDLITGLANGIKEAPGKLLSAVTSAVGGVIDKAKSLLGIHSPSKVFRRIGEYTMQGMGLGIEGAAAGAVEAMDSAVRDVVGAAAAEVDGSLPSGALAASGASGAAVYNITLNADIRDFEGLRTLDDLYEMLARAKAMNPSRAA